MDLILQPSWAPVQGFGRLQDGAACAVPVVYKGDFMEASALPLKYALGGVFLGAWVGGDLLARIYSW